MMENMSEENIEEVRVLEAQLEQLQAEVEGLQQQLQDNHKDISFNFRGHMQDAMSYICGQKHGAEKEKLQTRMNGISLKSCTTKTLKKSEQKLVQQLCVSGVCSDLVFQVEFLLSAVKKGEQLKKTISDLNVVIDASDLQTFSSFLSGCIVCPDNHSLLKGIRFVSGSPHQSSSLICSISETKPHLDFIVQSAESGKKEMEKYWR
ncbi:Centromere protein P [Dissostichus eleginoides]|uniref:Centromere protein P n=1 Tax=Dissostichus eleginoides TaxID=100907 RepID=A0AAD9CI12_DISEL|nr:Centromere protein P [Dissostichus eleginoides]